MMRMRGQEEIPGWVVHVLDVGARTKERWPRFAGVFPKTQMAEVVMKDGKEQCKGKIRWVNLGG